MRNENFIVFKMMLLFFVFRETDKIKRKKTLFYVLSLVVLLSFYGHIIFFEMILKN